MAGRPLKFKTAEELQTLIDEYFSTREVEYLKDDEGALVTDKYGNPVILHWNSPTITGLCLFLGFSSRKDLMNYQGRAAFLHTVSRAKLRIEASYEEKLSDPRLKPQGMIFALKNMGWRDNIDVNQSGGANVKINVIPASTAPKAQADEPTD